MAADVDVGEDDNKPPGRGPGNVAGPPGPEKPASPGLDRPPAAGKHPGPPPPVKGPPRPERLPLLSMSEQPTMPWLPKVNPGAGPAGGGEAKAGGEDPPGVGGAPGGQGGAAGGVAGGKGPGAGKSPPNAGAPRVGPLLPGGKPPPNAGLPRVGPPQGGLVPPAGVPPAAPPREEFRRSSRRERIGAFELVRPLGSGGMGEVHEAIDTRNGQRVALKMLFEVDPAGVYRLKREFRRMAEVAHENIISLYELHNEGPWWFFTMELLQGVDLRQAMQAVLPRGPAAIKPLLRQLVRGVHALHQAGRIHRDLKPSNVMVTDEGRVVILDFGLVNEIDHRTLFASTRGLIRGTPLFMAPEQAAGQMATPAADWYAVGVILFAALSGGRYPFERGVIETVLDKQERDAPRLSSFAPRIPAELDELVAGLLHRVPSQRPGVHELLAWCADDRASISLRLPAPNPAAGGLLEREGQAKALREGFQRALAGRPTCVDVTGEAGTGKTALVRQFVAEIARAGAIVLEGACSQREALRFRAFDGLLDAITAYLVQQPGRDVEHIIHDMGPGLYALAQIFPVLARVQWIATQAPRIAPTPEESRRQAFRALKLLLFRIAERRPTVVFLDNLQWGDLDSARLLDYLLAPPDVPACMLILAYRREARSPVLAELSLQRTMTTPSYALTEIETPPLSLAASARLAQRLLASEAPGQLSLVAQIGGEAGGNPLLIHALVEEAVRSGGALGLAEGGDLLGRLVRTRLARLSTEVREVFGRVVAAGGPLTLTDLLRSGAWEGDILASIAQLRGQGLVHLEGQGEGQCVVPASEPIRDSAAGVLDPELLRRSHFGLARALIDAEADEPDRIARHLFAAGLVEEAYEYASSAAYQATQALAFDRAVELYEFARQCKPDQWSLETRHAGALVLAGRGGEAAPLFVLAAGRAPGPAAARLLRQAAEQFLAHGDLERGMEILGPLLREAKIDVPTQGRELAGKLGYHSDRLIQRGYGFTERSEFELGRADMERIDLCWVAGKGLLLNDPARGSVLLTQCAHMALEAGEPKRIARYLGLCGVAQSSRSHAEADRMIAAAERVGEQLRDHYAVGLAAVCRGFLARSAGNWLAALTELDFGVQYLRENCPGSVWECGLAQSSTMIALEALGEFWILHERTEALLRRSLEAGDMHGTLIAALYSALTLVASGRTAEARARVREAFVRWPRPGFTVQHLHALKIGIYCDLYERRGPDAWQRISTTWRQLEYFDFLSVSVRRAEAVTLRARAGLAALRASPDEFGYLYSIIEGDIAQLEKDGGGGRANQGPSRRHLIAEAALLRAGLSACTGQDSETGRWLDLALSCFEGAGMILSAVAVRRLRGVRAGAAGARAVTQADALLAMQNIHDPEAWLRVIAPGLSG